MMEPDAKSEEDAASRHGRRRGVSGKLAYTWEDCARDGRSHRCGACSRRVRNRWMMLLRWSICWSSTIWIGILWRASSGPTTGSDSASTSAKADHESRVSMRFTSAVRQIPAAVGSIHGNVGGRRHPEDCRPFVVDRMTAMPRSPLQGLGEHVVGRSPEHEDSFSLRPTSCLA